MTSHYFMIFQIEVPIIIPFLIRSSTIAIPAHTTNGPLSCPVDRLYRNNRQTCTLLSTTHEKLSPINPFIQDNPLHIALFPPHTSQQGAYLDFSFILNASLDIFDLRARDKNRVDQDLGLLHAIDERLSVWGWETGTGIRFAIVLDMWGRQGIEGTGLGVREGELKPVSTLIC